MNKIMIFFLKFSVSIEMIAVSAYYLFCYILIRKRFTEKTACNVIQWASTTILGRLNKKHRRSSGLVEDWWAVCMQQSDSMPIRLWLGGICGTTQMRTFSIQKIGGQSGLAKQCIWKILLEELILFSLIQPACIAKIYSSRNKLIFVITSVSKKICTILFKASKCHHSLDMMYEN